MVRSIVFLTLFTITCVVNASDSFILALENADKIKSSDFTTFSNTLDTLEQNLSNFSEKEKLYFKYLSAYRDSYRGNLEQAIPIYQEIYESNVDSDIRFRALVSVVNNTSYIRDWALGLEALNTLIENINEISDINIKHQAYIATIIFYNQIGLYELANRYAAILLNENPEGRSLCFGTVQYFESLLNLELLENEFSKINDGIELCDRLEEPVASNLLKSYKVKYLMESNEYNAALQILTDSMDSVLSTRYPSLVAEFLSLASVAHFQLKSYKLAKKYALDLVGDDKLPEYKLSTSKAFQTLYMIAELEEDFKNAFIYHQKFAQVDKAYLDELKTEQLAYQQARHNVLEKTNRIALLDKENTLLRTQNELAKEQAQNNRLALALACTLLVLLFFWAYRSRRLQLQLRKLAETDDLTGICNRHHFNKQAAQTLNLSKQNGQPVSFLLFDLDHFKTVNDTFGHQTGDWVLKKAVMAAKGVCRQNDVIGRMGGEEFAILLPGCTLQKALQIAEMCRKAIADVDTNETGESFTITASFGVSDHSSCSYQLEKLFAGADAALYEAKQSGRNQIKSYTESHEPVPV